MEKLQPLTMRRSYMPLNTGTESEHLYVDLEVIGIGAYGTVYKARHRSNENHVVALKKIRVPIEENGLPLSTLREISLLKKIDSFQHPNIIRLLDICHGKRLEKEVTLFVVFEHVDQDLASYIERCPPPGLPSSTVKNLMHQILCGIDFLHTNMILHRDLKPQNLLITNSGNIKLADFGLAKKYDSDMMLTTVVVTLWYRSPEVLLGSSYATPVDIWSCGCIMAEMLTLRPLFSGKSEGDQLERIFSVIGTPKESEWPDSVSINWNSLKSQPQMDLSKVFPELGEAGIHLLSRMLRFNPHERISAAHALRHVYFIDSDYKPPVPVRMKSPYGDSEC